MNPITCKVCHYKHTATVCPICKTPTHNHKEK